MKGLEDLLNSEVLQIPHHLKTSFIYVVHGIWDIWGQNMKMIFFNVKKHYINDSGHHLFMGGTSHWKLHMNLPYLI